MQISQRQYNGINTDVQEHNNITAIGMQLDGTAGNPILAASPRVKRYVTARLKGIARDRYGKCLLTKDGKCQWLWREEERYMTGHHTPAWRDAPWDELPRGSYKDPISGEWLNLAHEANNLPPVVPHVIMWAGALSTTDDATDADHEHIFYSVPEPIRVRIDADWAACTFTTATRMQFCICDDSAGEGSCSECPSCETCSSCPADPVCSECPECPSCDKPPCPSCNPITMHVEELAQDGTGLFDSTYSVNPCVECSCGFSGDGSGDTTESSGATTSSGDTTSSGSNDSSSSNSKIIPPIGYVKLLPCEPCIPCNDTCTDSLERRCPDEDSCIDNPDVTCPPTPNGCTDQYGNPCGDFGCQDCSTVILADPLGTITEANMFAVGAGSNWYIPAGTILYVQHLHDAQLDDGTPVFEPVGNWGVGCRCPITCSCAVCPSCKNSCNDSRCPQCSCGDCVDCPSGSCNCKSCNDCPPSIPPSTEPSTQSSGGGGCCTPSCPGGGNPVWTTITIDFVDYCVLSCGTGGCANTPALKAMQPAQKEMLALLTEEEAKIKAETIDLG